MNLSQCQSGKTYFSSFPSQCSFLSVFQSSTQCSFLWVFRWRTVCTCCDSWLNCDINSVILSSSREMSELSGVTSQKQYFTSSTATFSFFQVVDISSVLWNCSYVSTNNTVFMCLDVWKWTYWSCGELRVQWTFCVVTHHFWDDLMDGSTLKLLSLASFHNRWSASTLYSVRSLILWNCHLFI